MKDLPWENYRFLDEAGDATFYGKGKIPVIGQNGVSKSFMIGMVKFKEPLDPIRDRIETFQKEISDDKFFASIPSIQKKVANGGFFFHATDDIPEVSMQFFKFIDQLNCSFEVYVGRKICSLYENQHHGHESEFYADLLSHLLKNKLNKEGVLKLVIAARGNTTKNTNLNLALKKATERNRKGTMTTDVKFDVQNQKTEPLLTVADYFCWTVQRVFERGETRYYDFMKDKISVIVDLYDKENYANYGNYYSPKKPITAANMFK
jgi:hypothetical protein